MTDPVTPLEARRRRDELAREIEELSRRIADDVERRRRLRLDRDEFARIVKEPGTGERRTGSGDLLVPAAWVVERIDPWLLEFGPNGITTLAAVARVSTRTIRAIRNVADARHREHVSLETADRLLTAVGRGWEVGEAPARTRAQALRRRRPARVGSLERWVARPDHGCGDGGGS